MCVYLTLSDVQKLVVGVVKNVWDFLKNKEVSQKSFGSLDGGLFFSPRGNFNQNAPFLSTFMVEDQQTQLVCY